jgi:hypothetical protein
MQIYVLNDVRMHAYYSLSALVIVLVHRWPDVFVMYHTAIQWFNMIIFFQTILQITHINQLPVA